MYNANIPSNTELPSTAKLIKSTLLALIGAGILLVTVVMPAEYGIDPTGVGKALGLKQMGDIKHALAHEVEADAKAHAVSNPETTVQKEEQPKSAKEIFHSRQPKGHHHGDGTYHQH